MEIVDPKTVSDLPRDWEKLLESKNLQVDKILTMGHVVADGDYFYDRAIQKEEQRIAVKTPWSKFTDLFGAIRQGELTILTGIEGHGKTIFGFNLIYAALCDKVPAGVIGLEMGPIAAVEDLFTMRFNLFANRTNMINNRKDWMDWNKRLYIYKKGEQITYDECRKLIAFMALCRGAKLILIDHFHSITKGIDYNSGASKLEHMTMDLRSLAHNLDISIVCICHPAKVRGDSKERLVESDDLKGSSGIKQYADAVLSIYWDKKADKNISQVHFHKIRNRQYGHNAGKHIKLMLQKPSNKFVEYEEIKDDDNYDTKLSKQRHNKRSRWDSERPPF